MKKILIERSLKLRREDLRSKTFNITSNAQEDENNWLDSFGGQKEQFYSKVQPKIQIIHAENANITASINDEDRAYEKLRMNMGPDKMNVTHQSSIRYKCIPKDHSLW